MLRLRVLLFLLLCAVVTTGASVRHTYLCLTNKAPLTMTLARYLKERPDNEWLRLENACVRFDLALVTRSTRTHQITSVYVPVWPDRDTSRPVQLVLDVTRTRRAAAESGNYAPASVETISGVLRPHVWLGCPSPGDAHLNWNKTAASMELVEGDAPSAQTAIGCGALGLTLWLIVAKMVLGVSLTGDGWRRADPTLDSSATRGPLDFFGVPNQFAGQAPAQPPTTVGR